MSALAVDGASALKLTVVVFMAASLFETGLRLPVGKAVRGLRSARLLTYACVFGFVLGPVLAILIARLLGLDAPYTLGLVLLGLTPCAPFLPALAGRAGADNGAVPGMMLFCAIATIAILPLALPLVSPGLTIDPLRLARPLLLFIVLPLALGMLLLSIAPAMAEAVRSPVHRVAVAAALAALALCIVIYGAGFVGTVGSYAIAAQLVLLVAIAAASRFLSPGLDRERRTVLVLAMSTRNVGAALAPLFASADVDQRAVVMVVLGVPMQLLVSLGAVRWLAREGGATPRTGGPEGAAAGPGDRQVRATGR